MLALAFLTVMTVAEHTHECSKSGLIRLSVNEFRRLFVALILPPPYATTIASSTGQHGAANTNTEPHMPPKPQVRHHTTRSPAVVLALLLLCNGYCRRLSGGLGSATGVGARGRGARGTAAAGTAGLARTTVLGCRSG